MIWNFKIWNKWLTIFLDFNVFAIIFTDWNTWVNDVRNNHHDFLNLFSKLCF